QQEVGQALPGNGPAVDRDRVAGDDERVQRPRSAVHEHPPGLDQLVGAAPRREPGPSEVGVQAHRPILTKFFTSPQPGLTALSAPGATIGSYLRPKGADDGTELANDDRTEGRARSGAPAGGRETAGQGRR